MFETIRVAVREFKKQHEGVIGRNRVKRFVHCAVTDHRRPRRKLIPVRHGANPKLVEWCSLLVPDTC